MPQLSLEDRIRKQKQMGQAAVLTFNSVMPGESMSMRQSIEEVNEADANCENDGDGENEGEGDDTEPVPA